MDKAGERGTKSCVNGVRISFWVMTSIWDSWGTKIFGDDLQVLLFG